jgi:hypothetical protein
LTIPIERIMPLVDAAEAQVIAEKGGIAKIVLQPEHEDQECPRPPRFSSPSQSRADILDAIEK